MLKKIFVLSIPLFVLFGTISTVVAFEHQRISDWESKLKQYRDSMRTLLFDVQVYRTVNAQQPWNFDEGMGRAWITPGEWPWQIDRLPFPPNALYCVLIERTPSTSAKTSLKPVRQLLYMAHHSDQLWRLGWVVHEGQQAPFGADDINRLAELGCDPEQLLQD